MRHGKTKFATLNGTIYACKSFILIHYVMMIILGQIKMFVSCEMAENLSVILYVWIFLKVFSCSYMYLEFSN